MAERLFRVFCAFGRKSAPNIRGAAKRGSTLLTAKASLGSAVTGEYPSCLGANALGGKLRGGAPAAHGRLAA
jgi:hypothetical protein